MDWVACCEGCRWKADCWLEGVGDAVLHWGCGHLLEVEAEGIRRVFRNAVALVLVDVLFSRGADRALILFHKHARDRWRHLSRRLRPRMDDLYNSWPISRLAPPPSGGTDFTFCLPSAVRDDIFDQRMRDEHISHGSKKSMRGYGLLEPLVAELRAVENGHASACSCLVGGNRDRWR